MSESVIGVTNATKFYRVKAALPLLEEGRDGSPSRLQFVLKLMN